jgi:hypothetical protein
VLGIKHSTSISILLLWLIEDDIFQMPQLHKHYSVIGNHYDSTFIFNIAYSDSYKLYKPDMKIILSILFLTIFTTSDGQLKVGKETAIQTVRKIFKSYIELEESVDSDENKKAMTKALKQLFSTTERKDLSLLIDVWMYYDPTDYPTRKLIEPIFHKEKEATLVAVEKRLKSKKKWESNDSAPYSELIYLRSSLRQKLATQ